MSNAFWEASPGGGETREVLNDAMPWLLISEPFKTYSENTVRPDSLHPVL